MNNNIITYTGRSIDPLSGNIQPEDIDILDIATALSRMPRFGGHSKYFYTVAQHSCMVADRLRPGLKLAGLLHDAAEAYLHDIPSPIKQHMPYYEEAEERLMYAVLRRFDIPSAMELWQAVKRADHIQLQHEISELMIPVLSDVWNPQDASPSFRCWYPEEAAHVFLEMFNSLYTES